MLLPMFLTGHNRISWLTHYLLFINLITRDTQILTTVALKYAPKGNTRTKKHKKLKRLWGEEIALSPPPPKF